jgi:hypothetical protein
MAKTGKRQNENGLSKINSIFLETEIENDCKLLNVGFYGYKAWTLQGCLNNTLKIYTSTCPTRRKYHHQRILCKVEKTLLFKINFEQLFHFLLHIY